MLAEIECPTCQTAGRISLVESTYEGPYRCWKCRALFAIRLNKGELTSCEPMSEEDLQNQQGLRDLQAKLKGHSPGSREESEPG